MMTTHWRLLDALALTEITGHLLFNRLGILQIFPIHTSIEMINTDTGNPLPTGFLLHSTGTRLACSNTSFTKIQDTAFLFSNEIVFICWI